MGELCVSLLEVCRLAENGMEIEDMLEGGFDNKHQSLLLHEYLQQQQQQQSGTTAATTSALLQLPPHPPPSHRKPSSASTSSSNHNNSPHLHLVEECSPQQPNTSTSSRLLQGGPCFSCQCTEAPQWRRPDPGTMLLCNRCGIHYMRYKKLPGPKREQLSSVSRFSAPSSPMHCGKRKASDAWADQMGSHTASQQGQGPAHFSVGSYPGPSSAVPPEQQHPHPHARSRSLSRQGSGSHTAASAAAAAVAATHPAAYASPDPAPPFTPLLRPGVATAPGPHDPATSLGSTVAAAPDLHAFPGMGMRYPPHGSVSAVGSAAPTQPHSIQPHSAQPHPPTSIHGLGGLNTPSLSVHGVGPSISHISHGAPRAAAAAAPGAVVGPGAGAGRIGGSGGSGSGGVSREGEHGGLQSDGMRGPCGVFSAGAAAKSSFGKGGAGDDMTAASSIFDASQFGTAGGGGGSAPTAATATLPSVACSSLLPHSLPPHMHAILGMGSTAHPLPPPSTTANPFPGALSPAAQPFHLTGISFIPPFPFPNPSIPTTISALTPPASLALQQCHPQHAHHPAPKKAAAAPPVSAMFSSTSSLTTPSSSSAAAAAAAAPPANGHLAGGGHSGGLQQQQQLQSMRTPHSLLNELLGAGVSSHSSGSLQQQSAHGLLNRLLDGGADKCGVASTPQLPNHLPYSLLQPKGPQGVPGDSSGSGKTVHGLGDDCIKTNNGAAAGPAPHHSIAGRNNAASVSSALRDSMFPSPATPAASHASAGGSSDSGGSGGIHTAAEAAPACPPFQQNQQQQDALAQALRAILGSCPLTSDALLHPGAAPPASLPPLQLPSLAAIPPLTSQAPPPSQASAAPRGQHVAAPAAPASSPPLSASLAAPSPLPSHATTSTPCALQKPQRGVPQAGNTGEQGALASAHECAPAHADQPLPQQQQQVPITLNSAAGAAEATGNPAAKRSSQTQQQQQQQHLPPAPAGGAAAAAASSSTLSCGLAMGEPPVVAAAHGI